MLDRRCGPILLETTTGGLDVQDHRDRSCRHRVARACEPGRREAGRVQREDERGNPISFERSGNTVKRVSAYIPATCVSAWPGYPPRSGDELFAPPGRLALGREVSKTALQDAALHHSEVTKNYRFAARKGARGAISGRLHVNYSFQTLGYTTSYVLIGYVCRGDATFKARPVRR